MTLLPASDFGIRGHTGKPYSVDERCSVPGCPRRSVHTHHIWPKSFLRGQPYEWVELPDGTVIGNRTGLCLEHHNMVTGEIGGHRALIMFRAGLFLWHVKDTRADAMAPPGETIWTFIGALDPQPPGVIAQTNGKPELEDEDVCPTCHRARRKTTPSPARNAKSWTVDVPDDGELGADNLDEIVVWIAETLGFDDERSRLRRYHALVHVLIWVIQQREEFIADLKEAAEA